MTFTAYATEESSGDAVSDSESTEETVADTGSEESSEESDKSNTGSTTKDTEQGSSTTVANEDSAQTGNSVWATISNVLGYICVVLIPVGAIAVCILLAPKKKSTKGKKNQKK